MTSILDMNSGSSDSEDDCDYVPPANAASDESEELSEDESEFLNEPASKKAKLSDTKGQIEKPVVKKSDDDIWKSFLQDVETTSNKKTKQNADMTTSTILKSDLQEKTNDEKPQTNSNNFDQKDLVNINASGDISTEEIKSVENGKSSGLISNAPAANKLAVSEDEKPNTELSGPASDIKTPVARGGISSILGAIANKGKKATVLQKSLQDWNSFKKDEGIEKDLETYNKGRQGYIERQRFLQRSDLLSYEKEREMRLFGKKR